jgi:hypothetical protein
LRLRLLLLLAVAIAAVALLGTAGTVLAFPFGGAVACPTCYGFERLGENSFIERAASPQLRGHAAEVLETARDRVAGFYGGLETQPRILVCVSEECYRGIGGGGTRGTALLDLALRLGPRGIDPVIAAHELSHVELHRRLGRIHYLMGAVPAWFDEGLAVVVSDDRRYLAPANAPDRCRVRADEPLPTGILEWVRQAGPYDTKQLYAKAACRVADWIANSGGGAAVMRLVALVSSGTPFTEAYRAARKL